jgi:sugar lactone lactonase YvrE
MLSAAAAVCSSAMAQVGGLQITAVNGGGNSIYDLDQASSGLLINNVATLNTDGAKHGLFTAIEWVPNPATGTLDLIVADTTKQQILRYSGPTYGTSTVLYQWSGVGKGPAQPNGLSVDGSGNLFVVSASNIFDLTPSLWVLPVNAQGNYGAPVLLDHSFGGVRTLAVTETLVANTTTPLWNAGDLLVLVVDAFNPRVLVYSQQAIAGVLAKPTKPLTGPTSTAITATRMLGFLAIPLGMDIWPADATHGTSLLISTLDGRIVRYDTSTQNFTSNFATGLGLGLAKIKTGISANVPYLFVAQAGLLSTGSILQFGAPPASGANKPLATLTKGVKEPLDLAITTSSSAPASSCAAPETCVFLGGAVTVQLSGPGASKVKGSILEQSCSVANDPRVTYPNNTWSCNGSQTLDVANYCPSFPHTIIPGSLCGHSGPSGSGFVVLKGTATGVDPNDNNTFVQVVTNIDALMPGSHNLNCSPVGEFGWAPRPDLPGNEGTIPEDSLSPFLIQLTGACDPPAINMRGLSMSSFGLALNTALSAMPNGLPGYVSQKYTNLNTTVTSAAITPNTAGTLQSCVAQSQTDFNNGVAGQPNGFSCAAYQITQCDAYVRNNLSAFSSNLISTGGNPNPAGDIDGRLANLYLTINTRVAGNPPNTGWPATNVPPCITISASPASVPSGTPSTLNWSALGLPATATCSLSSSNGTFNNTPEPRTGMVSTGALTGTTPVTYDLSCPGGGGSSGLAATTVTVTQAVATPPSFQLFSATPQSVPNGGAAALSWMVSGVPSGSYCTLSATDGTYATPNTMMPTGETSLYTGALTKTPTYTATLTCPGTGGATGSKSVSVSVGAPAVPAVISSFTATPNMVANGGSSSLSWMASNVPSGMCTLSASDGTFTTPSQLPANDSGVSTGALTSATYTATLTCPGTTGTPSATATTQVSVAPPTPPMIMSFNANPSTVTVGRSALLTWSTSGVPSNSQCTLTASDGTYGPPSPPQTPPQPATPVPVPANNPNGLDTGTLTLTPYYTATLTCPGTGGTTASKTLAGPNGLPVQQPTPINTPQGMAFAPNGNLYVANEDSGQVTVYAPGLPGSNGQLTALPGQTITLPTPTEVESPEPPNAAALAFDSAGDLFVVDNDNDQIDVFSPAGVLLTAYPLDRLSYEYPPEPTGIAVDGQGYVYVTAVTYPNAVLYVYKYSPQTTPMFTLVTTWTGDSNSNTWSWLYTAAIDGNYLLVGDSYYGEDTQVVAYALNDVRTPAAPGAAAILPVQTTFDSNGSYQVVSGIAIDASQNIYVSDPAFGRVDVFSSIVVTDSGVSGASPLGATGSIPAQDPMFSYSPTGVAVDGNVNVYAADGSNNTVDVFAPYASDCNAGVCSADFKYDFQPFVTLSFTTDDSDDITLSWSARGVLPSSASCTLSVYDGSDGPYPNPNALTTPPSGSYGQTGEATFSSSAGFGYAVIACPGATQSLNYGFTE